MAGSWTEASRRLVVELADGGGFEQLWAMLYAAQTAALRLALLPGLDDDLTFTDAALKLRDAREELERVHPLQAHLARGLSAAGAARAALAEPPATRPDVADQADEDQLARPEGLAATAAALAQALDAVDEPASQAVLDRLFAAFTVETVLREVVLPYLHALGERWQRGQVSVAQEHFASALLRGRLAALARGWGRGVGPLALLACAPGELHGLPLLAFGVVLHRTGWRIHYLGADTPLADLVRTAAQVRPDLVVVTAATDRLDGLSEPLADLARRVPLVLAGAGMTQTLADAVGARLLTDDPVTAAERMPPPATNQ